MGQSFDLGFQIDTTGLQRAGSEAVRSAEQVAKLGDAERKLATEAQKTGEALKKEGDAAKEASTKKSDLADKTTTLTGKLRLQQQDVMQLASAFRGQQGLVGGLDAAAQSGTRLLGGLGPMALGFGITAVAIGFLAKEAWDVATALGQAQDRASQMEARLKSALGSLGAARSAMKALYETTQETGLGFDAAADSFGRIARNNAAIGLTQTEMLKMVETVQKLGAVSGASGNEVAAGMVQFGQALASGRLQGDELRSIMENFPALAKAIADNFERADGKIGITIGTLRKMGSEGELTSGKIAAAVMKAQEKAEKEFASLPDTMDRSAKRMGDAWEHMLAEMGKKLNASGIIQTLTGAATGFVNGITDALAGPSEDEMILALQRRKADGVAGTYRGPSNFNAGSAAFNSNNFATGWTDQDEKDLNTLLASRNKRWQEQAQQAFNENQGKLIAGATATESQTMDFAPMTEKIRVAENTVTNINKAMADLQSAIDRGGTTDFSVADLTEMRDRLGGRLMAAQAAVDGIMSEYTKFARSVDDQLRARSIGGSQGGASIVNAAIQQQRGDQKTGVAGDLGGYINQGIRSAMVGANDELDSLARKVADARSQLSLVGADVGASMKAQVEQEAAMAQLQRFGTLQSPQITAWAEAYKKGLLEVKQAMQDAQEAQRALSAEIDAATARSMATAALDPISQGAAQLEAKLAQEAKGFTGGANDPEYIRMAEAERAKAADERLLSERMSNRELERQLELQGDMRGLQRLTRDEYQVQAALIQKRLELEYAGYDAASEYYKEQLRLTELLERGKIHDEKNVDPGTKILTAFEDQLDKVEGVWKSTWKTIFTDGVEEGAEIFGKGMTDIILDISAQMIEEIAIRPFAEMAKNMAMAFANWAVSSIFGGPAPVPSRDGNVFSFANGSPFSNKVHHTRTMFSFANGTALGEMAEAGPEAVMPLDRGSDGRLGVRLHGGMQGGETQVNIYDQRTQASEPVEVQERQGPDGRRMIDVMVRDAQKKNIRSGAVDRDMANTYGAQRQLAKK